MQWGGEEQANDDRVASGVGPEEADVIRLNGSLANAIVPFLGTLVRRRRVVRWTSRNIVTVRTLTELSRPAEKRAEGDENRQECRQNRSHAFQTRS